MSEFFHYKQSVLNRDDHSNKGSIDAPIKKLIQKLNRHPQIVTTSSCSGRIGLLTRPEESRKKDVEWIFKSHRPISLNDIKRHLEKKNLWFRMEGMILHMCCRHLKKADELVKLARHCGFKRSGIQSVKPERIMVEITGTDVIDTLVVQESILVPTSYLDHLITFANTKLENNHRKIERFLQELPDM